MSSTRRIDEEIHYSGVVVIVQPDDVESCAADLDALAGVEVHHRHAESGRLVAVVESHSAEEQQQTLRQIQALSGVRVAAPVYHYIDTPSNDEGES